MIYQRKDRKGVFQMNEDNKSMPQARGGILAQSDIELIKKVLDYYNKNSQNIDSIEQGKLNMLYHRLGRMTIS